MCSENILQIYRRTSMPNCDFNKVAKKLYWNHPSAWVFSCKFSAYFQDIFPKNTFRELLLSSVISWVSPPMSFDITPVTSSGLGERQCLAWIEQSVLSFFFRNMIDWFLFVFSEFLWCAGNWMFIYSRIC